MRKTTCIAIALLCLLSACAEKMICPAYQSVFILDDNYRERYFSPFNMMAGDTVPREKHRVQKQRSNSLIAKIWTRPERPLLENPYLLARIFNRRPYWKLDVIEPRLIHYVNTDTLTIPLITSEDSAQNVETIESVLRIPSRLPPYNQEQIEYNKRFGHLFPKPPKKVDPSDSTQTLEEFLTDTLATEGKKSIFGLFKKKGKKKRSRKQKKGN